MKYLKDKQKFYLSLDKGDSINKVFENFSLNEGIKCAWINGIGAIKNPEVGYYSVQKKVYQSKTFIGEYELTSLLGNISIKEGNCFSHTHITFSDINYQVYGGHLFEAKIAAAGEFILIPGKIEINREFNNNIGLPTWCME